MGIYSDIQADMKEAMADDLLDAVAVLTITEVADSTAYDPVDGGVTDVPVISIMDCIIVDADIKEQSSFESATETYDLEVMVLDSDKTTDFKTGLFANVRSLDYEIMNYKVDPAGATHSLSLRRK